MSDKDPSSSLKDPSLPDNSSSSPPPSPLDQQPSATVTTIHPPAATQHPEVALTMTQEEDATTTNAIMMMSPVEQVAPPDDDEECQRSIDGFKQQGRDWWSYFGFKRQETHVNEQPRGNRNGNVVSNSNSNDITIPNTNPNTDGQIVAVARLVQEPRRSKWWLLSLALLAVVTGAMALLVVFIRSNENSNDSDDMGNKGFEPIMNDLITNELESAYGRALALSRNAKMVAIGESRVVAGAVYVFANVEDRQWRQLGQTLYGSNPGNYFGDSLDISEDGYTIVIGSVHADIPNTTLPFGPVANWTDTDRIENAGHVEVYRYNETSGFWYQLGQLLYGDDFNDKFGEAVAISADGRKIAVGAVEESPGKAGFVKVYNYDDMTGTWDVMGHEVKGLAAADRFGYGLDLSADGRVLAVGGHAHNSGNGVVQIFEFSHKYQDWKQLGMTLFGEVSSETLVSFGISVALSGNGMTVAVGAPARFPYENSTDLGQVQVWEYVEKGQPVLGDHPGDQLGWSVDISSDGNVLAMGANRHNGNGPVSGHVRVYEYNGRVWDLLANDFAGNRHNKTHFGLGYQLALSPDGQYLAVQDDGGLIRADTIGTDESEYTGRVRVFRKM